MWTLRHLVAFTSLLVTGSAFSLLPLQLKSPNRLAAGGSSNWEGSGGGAGSIEQIEFKIFSDGRVEETVRGVKGNNCHKVTETINEKLGKVVASAPTEEMFEQELIVNQKISLSESSDSWDGSSSW
ncbi:predicted protein [Phaeodactylum tricornutum CCAP 1055/1]|jgi:hypothetical protein|uniref:Uncharacterized protein n=1 Tax=Phaeodactylum tricornutum (strain CCAP 1055/1) TaxID=556484 RepID=B7FY82_PHATC|nr:predicted protein [Phaeodactylum tricornutum CCAP 1055/1]EEC48879.1 predicted protein [Phaeodactylum tricornutum CCAP 1055/1]|eukprot:XP_002179893.1 predicted protein [Phaeodactylum tricornutum CCAP 1055/1]